MAAEVDKFKSERRATKAVAPQERVLFCVLIWKKRKEELGEGNNAPSVRTEGVIIVVAQV